LNEDTPNFKYYQRKIPYYKFFIDHVCDPENNKEIVRVKECPDHPANPNHPQHEPNHYDNWQPRNGGK